MEKKDYLQDIRDIKNMMSQSTQFISLSGLSGIMAGIYALVGGYVATGILSAATRSSYDVRLRDFYYDATVIRLIGIALAIIVLSILTGFFLSSAKAKKQGNTLWNASSKRLIVNFSIPLISGGIYLLLLIGNGHYEMLVPVMLLFYGMACVNAGKYTFRDVRYLGITLNILGLLSAYFIEYALQFWMLGFGICHVLYGAVMYFKYDRK